MASSDSKCPHEKFMERLDEFRDSFGSFGFCENFPGLSFADKLEECQVLIIENLRNSEKSMIKEFTARLTHEQVQEWIDASEALLTRIQLQNQQLASALTLSQPPSPPSPSSIRLPAFDFAASPPLPTPIKRQNQ